MIPIKMSRHSIYLEVLEDLFFPHLDDGQECVFVMGSPEFFVILPNSFIKQYFTAEYVSSKNGKPPRFNVQVCFSKECVKMQLYHPRLEELDKIVDVSRFVNTLDGLTNHHVDSKYNQSDALRILWLGNEILSGLVIDGQKKQK
jgi:hypothetical protein